MISAPEENVRDCFGVFLCIDWFTLRIFDQTFYANFYAEFFQFVIITV